MSEKCGSEKLPDDASGLDILDYLRRLGTGECTIPLSADKDAVMDDVDHRVGRLVHDTILTIIGSLTAGQYERLKEELTSSRQPRDLVIRVLIGTTNKPDPERVTLTSEEQELWEDIVQCLGRRIENFTKMHLDIIKLLLKHRGTPLTGRQIADMTNYSAKGMRSNMSRILRYFYVPETEKYSIQETQSGRTYQYELVINEASDEDS